MKRKPNRVSNNRWKRIDQKPKGANNQPQNQNRTSDKIQNKKN
jgi:hypothetical protein